SDIAKEEKLSVRAVGLIDERFGKKMHLDSNEWMIQQTGLLGYFQYQHTPFYPILQKDMTLENTALQYDEQLRFLLNGFSQSIGVLGIGIDGHIAGLPIHTAFDTKEQSLVTSFTDFPGPQKQRISMTFLGLSMLDIMLVLVFGEDKKHALQAMLSEGNEEDIPARFFKRKDIAQKTLIITDQKV
ncbi:MAG: 6-phosphogluconolactonase, partial [Candidatus Levybacteria bacterium]|nr:6-phosphogluconolactonase [Candidatus Levybacteria bacterium]